MKCLQYGAVGFKKRGAMRLEARVPFDRAGFEPVPAPSCEILWATCMGAYPDAPARLRDPKRLVARACLPFRRGLRLQERWQVWLRKARRPRADPA